MLPFDALSDSTARSRVFVDSLEQCLAMGDLRAAVAAGAMSAAGVAGDLGAVVVGRQPGRLGDREIVVFDSTGIGAQDVAAAAAIYERALVAGVGRRLTFGE